MVARRQLVSTWPLSLLLAIALITTEAVPLSAEEGTPSATSTPSDVAQKGHRGPACMMVDTFFADEVWAKVGERSCLKCHRTGGDAAESDFRLFNTTGNEKNLAKNRAAFLKLARVMEKDESRLLLKARGGLEHGGGEVLKADSTGFHILERLIRRLNETPSRTVDLNNDDLPPFFEGVEMLSPTRLLRRVTLSLAGRLPTQQELSAVKQQGPTAWEGLLKELMKEDVFYERLTEGFNDIFLTMGYDGNGEEILSYDHFQPTRLWYQKHDLSDVAEKEQQRARWDLARVYRESIRQEPLQLIKHIVRNDRPFTELVTADYIMVSPYSARGYGLFDEVKDQFNDPDDPFEYVPAKLTALKSRNGKVQESETGFYPHAGFLGMFHYLRRYPTTETNRNRLRARMYYQHFLGIDVMALAPRVTDAAAVSEKYEIPTMQAADCVVCHKTIDPVAGLFQDYNEGGHLGPRKEGWYTDMFGPGFEGEELAPSERWRALQWLGERTAKDPRFAVAMAEHVYYILIGRKVLQLPEDIDDPHFAARRRAYQVQRELINNVAEDFSNDSFNLKTAFTSLINSKFYRVDGLATVADDPQRQAELDDVGLVRLLTPELLERKIAAVFGQKWGRLVNRESKLTILYGGIDSKSVTERITEPSGAMGAIQRIMANDVACKNVARDFGKLSADRTLFPHVELSDVPGNAAADETIRNAIVHLHEHILGQIHPAEHPEVERTYRLFAGIVEEAQDTQGVGKIGSYSCDRVDEKRLDDPDYTLRAWRGVVTYLLRQHGFLYE